MPSRLSCSPRSTSSLSATASVIRTFLRLLRHRRFVVDLNLSLVLERADHLVSAGDDLIALVEAAQHLDIGCAGDAGLHLVENRLAARNHEDALNLFLAGLLGGRIGLGGSLR